MYLLEAKKKAEQEYREEKAREARHKAVKAQKKQAESKHESKKPEHEIAQAPKVKDSKAALEAQQALELAEREAAEAAQIKEAIRRSKQDVGGRSAAPVRLEENPDARRDLVVAPVKVSHASSSHALPPRPKDATPTPRKDVSSGAWQDAEVTCKYVGTFEVGTKVDKATVKAGIRNMKVRCLGLMYILY